MKLCSRCNLELSSDMYYASNPWGATAKRRAALMQAMPSWADPESIGLFYEFAALLAEATGETHEVDHIVPLQGERVSGLHVEANLRVITRTENRRKSNKFEEIENG